MGTPTESSWPGVNKLSNYKSLVSRSRFYHPRALSKVVTRLLCIPNAEEMAISLLQLRPDERPSAIKAMQHPYFEDLPKQLFDLPPSSPIFSVPGVYFETECTMPLTPTSPSSTLHHHPQCLCDPYLASPPHSGSQQDDSGVLMIDDDSSSTPTSNLQHSFSQTFSNSYHCPSSHQLLLPNSTTTTLAAAAAAAAAAGAPSSGMSRSMFETIPGDAASSSYSSGGGGGVMCPSESLRYNSMTQSFHSSYAPTYQNKYSIKYLKQAVHPSAHIKLSNSLSKESFLKQLEQHHNFYCQPHVKSSHHNKCKVRSSSTEYCPNMYSSSMRHSSTNQNISLSSAKSFDNYRV